MKQESHQIGSNRNIARYSLPQIPPAASRAKAHHLNYSHSAQCKGLPILYPGGAAKHRKECLVFKLAKPCGEHRKREVVCWFILSDAGSGRKDGFKSNFELGAVTWEIYHLRAWASMGK